MYQYSIGKKTAAIPASTVMRSAKKQKKSIPGGGRSLIDLQPAAVGIQTKLTVNQPGDRHEQVADSMADRVIRMCDADTRSRGKSDDAPARAQELTVSRHSQGDDGGGTAPPIVDDALRSPGQALDTSTRSFMEPRFGHDFSQVRVHTDTMAAESARAVNAAAYTVGQDIVFGSGYYSPGAGDGQRLLAHELTHVVQQGGAGMVLQRATLSDFNDTDPLHESSKLTDAQIESTNEYKAYMNSSLVWQWKDHVTRAEALLACRLMLRHMRAGNAAIWSSDGRVFMNQSRSQLGTLTKTQGAVGSLEWVRFDTGQAVVDPSRLDSDFARWILAGGAEPNASTGKVNCWEMVMFSAYKGGFTTKARIEGIYNEGVKQVKDGKRSRVGDTVEVELRTRNEYILDPKNPKSPEPLPGDIIIFSTAGDHVAISLGTRDGSGRHKIISHWPPPDGDHRTKETTIEELLASPQMAPGTVVKFWSPKW